MYSHIDWKFVTIDRKFLQFYTRYSLASIFQQHKNPKLSWWVPWLSIKKEVTQNVHSVIEPYKQWWMIWTTPKPFPKRERPQKFLDSVSLLTPTPLYNFDLTMKLLRRSIQWRNVCSPCGILQASTVIQKYLMAHIHGHLGDGHRCLLMSLWFQI